MMVNEPRPGPPAGGAPENPIPEQLAVLPSKDAVLYPFMLLPLAVADERWVRLISDAAGEHRPLGLFLQQNPTDTPGPDDLHAVGTAANLVRLLKQPDGSVQVLLQGIARVGRGQVLQTEPQLVVEVQTLAETSEPN